MSMRPTKKLGEIVDFFSGYAWKAAKFSDDVTGIPIIRIQNVDAVRQSDFAYWIEDYDPRFLIDEGDILLTLSGSFRVEVWPGPKALLNQRIVKVTPKKQVNKDWLLFALRNVLAEIEGMGRHALVNNVALADLRDLVIPLPPLDEQKRIAGILDQADALRTKRKQALTRLNQLGQAIFVEMFGDQKLNQFDFPMIELGDLIKVSSGSGLIGADQKGGRYPVYGGNGINGWHDEFTVPSGTIVIGRVGVYCGAVHVTHQSAWVTDNALIVSLKQPINTSYLTTALKVADLNQYAGRSAQPLVSGSRIYPVKIPNPPIEKQKLYEARIVELNLTTLNYEEATDLSNRLFSTLQYRAFKGEL